MIAPLQPGGGPGHRRAGATHRALPVPEGQPQRGGQPLFELAHLRQMARYRPPICAGDRFGALGLGDDGAVAARVRRAHQQDRHRRPGHRAHPRHRAAHHRLGLVELERGVEAFVRAEGQNDQIGPCGGDLGPGDGIVGPRQMHDPRADHAQIGHDGPVCARAGFPRGQADGAGVERRQHDLTDRNGRNPHETGRPCRGRGKLDRLGRNAVERHADPACAGAGEPAQGETGKARGRAVGGQAHRRAGRARRLGKARKAEQRAIGMALGPEQGIALPLRALPRGDAPAQIALIGFSGGHHPAPALPQPDLKRLTQALTHHVARRVAVADLEDGQHFGGGHFGACGQLRQKRRENPRIRQLPRNRRGHRHQRCGESQGGSGRILRHRRFMRGEQGQSRQKRDQNRSKQAGGGHWPFPPRGGISVWDAAGVWAGLVDKPVGFSVGKAVDEGRTTGGDGFAALFSGVCLSLAGPLPGASSRCGLGLWTSGGSTGLGTGGLGTGTEAGKGAGPCALGPSSRARTGRTSGAVITS